MSRAKTAEFPAEGTAGAGNDAVNANTEAGAVGPAGAGSGFGTRAGGADEPTAEAGAAGPTDVAPAAAEGETEQAEAGATETAAAAAAAESGAATSEPAAEAGGAAGPAGAGSAPATAEQAAEAETEQTEAEAEQAEQNEATAEGEAESTPAKPRPAWRRLPALLLAAALVLTGAGVWFTLEARSAASTPAAANLALTDVGATADVTSAVSLAVNRIFSYSYDRTDVTEKAAAAVLRGAAKDSYDKLFAEVRRKAPEQKLVLTSRVSAIAVQELENGHARLLVFLDQSAVRADNNATDSAAAQLSVTAEHTRDGWVITQLDPR
ncbi:hypothetical protein [Amycolatopsis sp. NPDC051102]|uniref:hypothetical protein n=1 Tax=Amycolatopsis sp. NPDC051102 TaxID=3155163 RepID=UPI003420091B